METLFDTAARPVPVLFQNAVGRLAAGLGLESEPLIQGCALDADEFRFWLLHHSDADPTGLTIAMDMGSLPGDASTALARTASLLEYNASLPVARHGWYGWLPPLERLVYCMRVELEGLEDPEVEVTSRIGDATQSMREIRAFPASR